MSTPNDTDLFLIERSGTQYKLSYEDMSTLNDDDLLLVERSGTQYKIEAQYVSTGPSGYLDAPVTVATPLNGAGLNAGQSYEPLSSAIVSESNGVITFTDDTELAKIVGPVKMVDANGNVKTPQTSAITQNTTLSGELIYENAQYTGNNTGQTVNAGIDNTTGKSLVWIKSRTNSVRHMLYDTLRGPQKTLSPNTNGSETNYGNSLTAFTSSGFTIGSEGNVSGGSQPFAAWNFKAAPGFLDIVTFSGSNSNQQIPHALGSEPGFILVKKTNGSEGWYAYHKDAGWENNNVGGNWLIGFLNGSERFDNYGGIKGPTFHTDQYFTVDALGTGNEYVAYVFGNDGANIKCGGYPGNGPSTVVDCGFKPEWVMIKCSNATANWQVYDRERNGYLKANTSETEAAISTFVWSNTGFSFNNYDAGLSNVGRNYIYVAIAEGAASPDTFELTFTDSTDLPFLKEGDTVTTPVDTTQTAAFSAHSYYGNSPNDNVRTNGIDFTTGGGLVWLKHVYSSSGSYDHYLADTVRGVGQYLSSNGSNESQTNSADAGITSFNSNGFTLGDDVSGMTNYALGGSEYISYSFRRAPGFFDIQKIETGSGPASQTFDHDLGAVPGMMLVKYSQYVGNWMVYHKSLGNTYHLSLNSNAGATGPNTTGFYSAPTSTQFTLGSEFNNAGEVMVYLFADDDTNIKCGTYTGTGSPLNVALGFEAGWLLTKRTDSSGNWHISDSERKTASGTYNNSVWANLSNGEDSNQYYRLDSTSFRAGYATSVSGATYVYIAIKKGATAGDFGAITTLLTDANATTKKVEVENSIAVGKTLTGPTLNTVSNTVSSQSGSTLTVASTTGNWYPGLYAEGATVTRSGPSPTSIVFTSANSGTTAVTGFDATLARRVWTLESASSASGPWSVVGSYQDTAANASQDGATPWGNPTLAANTFYRVKVKYESLNSDPVESIYNTFRTGAA